MYRNNPMTDLVNKKFVIALMAACGLIWFGNAASEDVEYDDDDDIQYITVDESYEVAPVLAPEDHSGLLPPNARPGECYAKVVIPPKYETRTQQVIKTPARTEVKVIPAQYTTVTEKVMVREASERLEVIPATYKWVEERVLVKPESTRLEVVPAEYETVTDRVLDKPARTVWKKGTGPIQKIDHTTGDIMCLVEEPATYKTVSRQVLKRPETTREITIPAVYVTERRQVVDRPAQVRKIPVPAQYKTVTRQKLVRDAETRTVEIPATYQTVTSQEKVGDSRLTWQTVLCETNTSPQIGFAIQRALYAKGYNPGPIDGHIGTETLSALERYQRDNNLARGGVTIDSLRHLGVNPAEYTRTVN